LRERREDLGVVYAAMMIDRRTQGAAAPRLTPEAARALLDYDWPGNVRELKHVIETCAVLGEGGAVRAADLPEAVRSPKARAAEATPPAFSEASRQDLRERLVATLEAHSGNIAAVAQVMRTSRTQVYRWLKRFEIDAAAFGRPRER
jgi:transcriptional regulator of acetoin/glycerol metabolism